MCQELKSDEANSLNGAALDKLWTSWSLYKASNLFLKPGLFPLLTLLSSAVSGAGEWICVLSVAPVDRSHLRLQAERTGGHKGSQRFPLPVLRGLRELGHHHRPSAQRGKTPRLRGQWALIQRRMLIYEPVLRVWITLSCFFLWVSIRHWPVLFFFLLKDSDFPNIDLLFIFLHFSVSIMYAEWNAELSFILVKIVKNK